MTTHGLLKKLKKANIMYRDSITLRSGKNSNYYADVKKVYGNPELLTEIARTILISINENTTCLAASGYGGVPLGVAASQISGLPLALVRDTEKNHGKQGMIDGYMPTSSDSITILDDVFTTGSSLRETSETLKSTGAHIRDCHVVVARGETKNFTLPVSYLFTSQDLIESEKK